MNLKTRLTALIAVAALCFCTVSSAQTLYVTTDQDISSSYDWVYVGKDSTLTQNYNPIVNVLDGTIFNTLFLFNASKTTILDGTSNTILLTETSRVTIKGPGVVTGTVDGRGSSLVDIKDGTSNTIIIGETASGSIRGGANTGLVKVRGNGLLDIADGTSNTIQIGENGRANLRGGQHVTVDASGNSLSDITDGTSNTLIVGEDSRVNVRGGIITGDVTVRGHGLADITDGTSNTIVIGETGSVNLRGGFLTGNAIYSIGNGALNLYASSYALNNPTLGTFGIYSGTYWDLFADFSGRPFNARYFAASSDTSRNIYNPQFSFTAVPEPGAAGLLAALIMPACCFGRLRRRS